MKADFEAIHTMKTEWDALQPLAQEHHRRLWQKLRLEWNYHSNHIEGNTLTYGETELLLIHGATHGNHTIREYEEMKAHDVGIAHVRELAEDQSRLIGETDIRNLNKIILKEPYWKPAQTSEGQATRKQIIPGEYKTTPNNVITATGELFEFAAPSDVPSRMQALVQWLEQTLSAEDPPILPLIAKLHHEFVLIHPFDDGNGRVARMLVNYVLMRQGYPPVIVPTERKKDYLAALRLADAGDITELENFLGTCVIRSLELGIKAAKGESIEEPSDVEKKVTIFAREQMARRSGKTLDVEGVRLTVDASVIPFVEKLTTRLKTLEPLFSRLDVRVQDGLRSVTTLRGNVPYSTLRSVSPGQSLLISYMFYDYQGESSTIFNHETVIEVHFPSDHYTVTHKPHLKLEREYGLPLLAEEIDIATAQILSREFQKIRNKSESV
jgi:Fic family protein